MYSPALDSVGSVLDRLKALPARLRAGWSAHKPVDDSPTDHTRQQAVIAMQGGGSSPAAAIDSNEAHVSPPAVKIADNADDMTKVGCGVGDGVWFVQTAALILT